MKTYIKLINQMAVRMDLMEMKMLQLAQRVEILETEMQKLKEERKMSPCTPLKGKEESKREPLLREKKFQKPSAEEVQDFLDSLMENRFSGQDFLDYYESVGWTVGKNKPMKNWKCAVRLWINNRNKEEKENQNGKRYRYESAAEREQRIRDERNQEFYKHIRQKIANFKPV